MMCGGVWGQTTFPVVGKPYALRANTTAELYLDPQTTTNNGNFTINTWSDKCILTFTASTNNSGYYSMQNKNGYYAAVANNSGWNTTSSTKYSSNTADWKFTLNDGKYRLSSIKNANAYLGVDNTSAGSSVFYNKNSGAAMSWTVYSVYTIQITGQTANITIGGQNYDNNSYYRTTSATVNPDDVTPKVVDGYEATTTVNDNTGIITVTYKLAIDPTDITINTTSPMTIYVGNSSNIDVALTPSNAYKKLSYTSSNTSVATVDANGKVTAKAVGSTTITVQAEKINGDKPDGLKKTITVNVKQQVATPVISFEPTDSDDGNTAKAKITCATSGASISYSINDGTWTAYPTGGFTVKNLDVVKAKAVVDDASWDDSEIATLTYSKQKVPTPTINVRGYEVTFSCDEPGVTYYYTTNGSTPTTNSTKWNGSTITSSAGTTIKVIATKDGYSPSEVASTTLSAAHVVYLRLTGAQGSRDGSSAANAVGSWADAFAKLGYGPNAKYLREQWANHGSDANTRNLANNAVFNGATYTSTVDNNIIYLVGDVSENNFSTLMGKTISDASSEYALMNPIVTSGFFKPVTISGKYANSTASSTGYARISLNAGSKYTLNEDMRFEYVEFYGNNGSNSTDFQMAYYDLEMGEGITCKNFLSTKDFSTYHHGYKQGVTNAAHILFYGGISCDKRFGTSPNGALNFDYYLPHPSGYKITIRSGFFSTISPGGTQWDSSTSLNGTMGSPNTPVKCTITVDIDRKWNDDHQTGVLGKTANGNPDCDVAVVIAGVHEGNIYGDVDIIVKSGRIDRVVNGTFGANNFISNHPADSYFGRANILIDPREPSIAERATYPTKNSLVVIRELYGGGLGRFKSSSTKTNQSSTYFYGKSSVTINGGTFKSAIYASGAGGVNGIGDDAHHTNDTKLPYLNGTTIAYGDYTAYKSGTKLNVTCHQSRGNIDEPDFHTNDTEIEETIDLSQTSANIQIHGGVFGSASSPIEGIFGGGYGFVDSELINYTGNNGAKPNTRAGAIFAPAGQLASSVLIDGDAEIYGNVYGAGRGSDTYNIAKISFNGDTYTQLGQVAGNVELTIGGDAKIHGSVYGAGLGIDGLTNMARLYGNTTLTVKENAVITGGVYGGGKNGIVDQNGSGYGNTTVNIIGGTIGSSSAPQNVHGGGLGSQTRVMGSVNLTVGETNATTGATIYGDVYGGSAQGKTNGDNSRTANAVTNVTLNAGTINGSLYGGGLGTSANPADVYGPVQVNVYGGTINTTSAAGSGAVYGCNNVAGAPQSTVKVDIYKTDPHGLGSDKNDPSDDVFAIDAVYGGGNMAHYKGTPQVTVHGCDNSIGYVYGGGNAADVQNTDVTIWGGNRIGYVFGGGHGDKDANPQKSANIGGNNVSGTNNNGNVAVKIYGGTIDKVFAGSNSKGNISGSVSLTVNKQGESGSDGCPMHIGEVYGGGNLADGNAGSISIGCTGGTGEGIGTVYGGANNANIGTSANHSDITLNITGGSIDNVFGGNNNGGTINGTITVNANWAGTCGTNKLGNVYGAGNIAEYTGNPTVNIINCTTTGSIFGGGKGKEAVVVGNPTVTIGDWKEGHSVIIGGDVFGGGDLAAVEGNPSVTIRDCGTLINGNLYGGGNAAPVYSTNTTMWGGTVKGNVFGGGNGSDATKNAKGAQVGYKRDDAATAGSGNAVTKIYGGTVGTWDGDKCTAGGGIFGGSNTTGNIAGKVDLFLDEQTCSETGATKCTLKIKEIYGAGNEAAFAGTGINFNLGCVTALSEIYGGAKNADLSGDVHLIISSGHFNKVFAGNNLGGSINGSIKVTIEETGCNPVIIDELYGGGNMAAYTTPSGKDEPTVEVISCTHIGQVFGGGYGKSAVVTGNPVVNINQIPGKFANKIDADSNGEADNDENALGTIGTVFGGGNAANVVGNTNVNIGTKTTVNLVSGSDHTGKTVKGVNITGNVYGGGNAADVTGKTNVTVGK